jgi:hypothetical protein
MDLETGGARNVWLRRIKLVLRSIALLLGGAQLLIARNGISPDGRSYSEIARAYLRHDWAMAINAYWSPLYSWLIALALQLGKPSLRQEYPLLHVLNFFIFIIAIAGFEFFWNGLLTAEELKRAPSRSAGPLPLPTFALLPAFALWILGYALFIWLTVGSVIWVVGPDLCVAAIALFVAGLLVRIKTSNAVSKGTILYIWLGIALGLAYLAKAVMFPMAFVLLGATLCLRLNWRNVARVGLALLIFATIAGPQIIVLSRAKGRPTFSDSGKLNFAWNNYDLPNCNWQGQADSGLPLHPTRMVDAHLQMFEFNGPIRASYPPWYDPSYWNEGISPKLRIGLVFPNFVRNAMSILAYFTRPRVWIAGVILLLFFCQPGASIRGISQYWYLIVPSVCLFAAYSLTAVDFRYMTAWLLMVWGSVLAGLRLRPRLAWPRIANSIAILVAFVMVASVANGLYGQSKSIRHDDATRHYAIAEGLTRLGVRRGDKVGAIGFDNDAHWAYLDGLMIVAEIRTGGVCDFWDASASDRSDVLHKFAQAGATAIIVNGGHNFKSTSRDVPFNFAACSHADSGWHRIGDTEDYVYFVD